MKIIFFLLPIIVISLIIPAYAEKGSNYDDIILSVNNDGTQNRKLTIVPERILIDGQYSDFRFINGAEFLSVETGHGSVKLNKNTCSFDFYQKGIIEGIPLFTDSIIPKIATNGINTWSIVTQVNNAVCEASGNENQLVAKKYSAGVGFMEYKYINTGSTWKTQLEATNISGFTDKKFGFTQTIDLNRDSIKFGNNTKNLDDFSGQTFQRTFLEDNQAKVLNLLNDFYFDFDLGFDNLESVYVLNTGSNKSKISFNYFRNAQILLPNETLIIDPTITQSSGGAMNNMEGGAGGGTQTRDAIKLGASSALNGLKMNSISFWIKKTASPTGAISVNVRDNADVIRASSTTALDASALTTSFVKRTFNFNQITLIALDKITLEFTGGDGSNYITDEGDGANPYDGVNTFLSNYSPSSWVDNTAYDHKFELVYTTTIPPWAVTTLTNPSETTTTEGLSWTAPYAGGGNQVIIGYQINKTTPWGLPLVLVNDTGTTTTTYTATGLTPGTNYSFRVSAWTNVTNGHPLNNATGNILNVTTPLNSYGTVAPANLNAIPVICNPALVNLEWTSGAMQNINGYRLQRETPVGGGFANVQIGGNTTNTLLYYNDTGRVANNNYNYRVYSLNQSGISAASNVDSTYTCHKPNAVTTLTGSATDLQTIILTWTAPVPYAPLLGYMINYTTPQGSPTTIFDANTGTSALTDTVYGLSIGLNYSFRVSPVTIFGSNSSGNIFNATTTTAFELGDLDLTDTINTDDFKIFYNRTNTNATSILLDVTYPSSYTLTCNMQHKFSRDNNTYTGLTETPIVGPGADVDNVVSSFVFNGANTEVILVNCYDTSIPDEAKYIITVTDFELLNQLDNFRNGTYGTRGQIGGLDLISLIVVIIGMIGFNRVTPIAGVIFMATATFALSWFGIIEWYQIMYPALALVILLAWVRTRQSD